MKLFFKITTCLLLALSMTTGTFAQSTNKQLKKDLKSKVEKDCRKEAKQLTKQGWMVMPGKLPMDRQIQEGRYAELAKDANGKSAYFCGSHMADGGNYTAAKKIADSRARTELAERVNSRIREMIKENISNTNYGGGDMETIDEFVSTNKHLVDAQINGVVPVVEIYREKQDRTYEVRVMVILEAAQAMKMARSEYKTALGKQSEKLAEALDALPWE